jgi:hypothetical protein
MLNPAENVYWILVNRVTRSLGILPVAKIIRLPTMALTAPLEVSMDPAAWLSGDAEVMSHSVFRGLGEPGSVVLTLPGDDSNPTRGVFLTMANIIRYNKLRWLMGSAPLVFRSSVCDQREKHVHVAFVLRYYSSSPGAL